MNAREVALQVLNDTHTKQAYANIALTKYLNKYVLSEQDRRLVTELVYGTVKAEGTLLWILNCYSSRPIDKVVPIIQEILKMGAYQIRFMTKIPVSAACNQAVELAKKYGHAGTVKFVNAVLRNLIRSPEKSVYPSIEENAARHIALAYCHPEWLVKRWIKRYGAEQTMALCTFNNENAALSLRINTLKTDREELLATLDREGAIGTPSKWTPDGVVCTSHHGMASLVSLQEGLSQVQDESSMLVAHVLAPKPGEFIIDTCSAPGGKTTHIAALMQNCGRILATDIYEHKLAKIRENSTRLGIGIIEAKLMDATLIGDGYTGAADRVLVDAPCSGMGVLRRRPDARWRKEIQTLRDLPKLQMAILISAAKAVKPGGILVYSTCTIEPEENEDVVNAFLQNNEEFYLEPVGEFMPLQKKQGNMVQFLPHVDRIDGFFIARMKRKK